MEFHEKKNSLECIFDRWDMLMHIILVKFTLSATKFFYVYFL